MMLFDGVGSQLGLLSGGCLESDIQRHARKVMQTGHSLTLCYDGSDEDDISFQLGIGCGGTVHIVLALVDQSNQYLCLDHLYASLNQRVGGRYIQGIPGGDSHHSATIVPPLFEAANQDNTAVQPLKSGLFSTEQGLQFITEIVPEPSLLIVGGGIDALPVVGIAQQLGWQVSLCDPRPANGRRDRFGDELCLLDTLDESLVDHAESLNVGGIIIMTHNVEMDARALQLLSNVSSTKYLALLGPVARKEQVLNKAGLLESEFSITLSSPAGFDIGGELPESIALSILSECHHALYKKQSHRYSHQL
mgnify:CR=1 FL=1